MYYSCVILQQPCTVVCCGVLCCAVLYCAVLFRTVLWGIIRRKFLHRIPLLRVPVIPDPGTVTLVLSGALILFQPLVPSGTSEDTAVIPAAGTLGTGEDTAVIPSPCSLGVKPGLNRFQLGAPQSHRCWLMTESRDGCCWCSDDL